MCWENVDGCRSSGSPKGADFAAVLEEVIKVCDEEASDIRVSIPDAGWPASGCYYAEDGSWSIAYRTVDAQHWGTPQRRRRLCLVADFNGPAAPEILFDPQLRSISEGAEPDETEHGIGGVGVGVGSLPAIGKGLPGYPDAGGETRESSAAGTERSLGEPSIFGIDLQGGKGGANYTENFAPTLASDSHGTPHAVSFQERAGKPGGGKGILIQDEHTGAIGTQNVQSVFCIQGNTIDRDAKQNGGGVCQDDSHTLNSTDRHGIAAIDGEKHDESNQPVVIPIEGNGTRESHYGAGFGKPGDPSFTLNHVEQHKVAIAYAVDCRNATENPDVNGTLQAKKSGVSYNTNNVVRVAVDVYNQTVDGDTAASVTAATGGTNTSGPKIMEWQES